MNSDQGIVGYSAMEPDWSSEVGKGLLISLGNNLNFRRWPGELGQKATSQALHRKGDATCPRSRFLGHLAKRQTDLNSSMSALACYHQSRIASGFASHSGPRSGPSVPTHRERTGLRGLNYFSRFSLERRLSQGECQSSSKRA